MKDKDPKGETFLLVLPTAGAPLWLFVGVLEVFI